MLAVTLGDVETHTTTVHKADKMAQSKAGRRYRVQQWGKGWRIEEADREKDNKKTKARRGEKQSEGEPKTKEGKGTLY